MKRTIEKCLVIFGVLVFVIYLNNHGMIKFEALTWVTDKVIEICTSDEIKDVMSESKDISKDVLNQSGDAVNYISDKINENAEESTEEVHTEENNEKSAFDN